MPNHHPTPADLTTVNSGPMQGTVHLENLAVWTYPDPNYSELWVAYFPALDLYTHGDTPQEAFKALQKTTQAFVESVQNIAHDRLNATTTTTTPTTHGAETDRT